MLQSCSRSQSRFQSHQTRQNHLAEEKSVMREDGPGIAGAAVAAVIGLGSPGTVVRNKACHGGVQMAILSVLADSVILVDEQLEQ